MTGMSHAGASVREVDGFWGVFCRASGLRGAVLTGVLGLAGEDCGVEAEELCLASRAVRLAPAGRALSRYL